MVAAECGVCRASGETPGPAVDQRLPQHYRKSPRTHCPLLPGHTSTRGHAARPGKGGSREDSTAPLGTLSGHTASSVSSSRNLPKHINNRAVQKYAHGARKVLKLP